MYQIEDIRKYAGKKILCTTTNTEKLIKEGEYYLLKSIDDIILNEMLYDGVGIFMEVIDTDGKEYDLKGTVMKIGYRIKPYHLDNNFSEEFRLITKEELRKKKIESVLDS